MSVDDRDALAPEQVRERTQARGREPASERENVDRNAEITKLPHQLARPLQKTEGDPVPPRVEPGEQTEHLLFDPADLEARVDADHVDTLVRGAGHHGEGSQRGGRALPGAPAVAEAGAGDFTPCGRASDSIRLALAEDHPEKTSRSLPSPSSRNEIGTTS